MSKNSERIYLERRMKTLFGSVRPNVPIGFQNTNFKEPKGQVYGLFSILGGKGVTVGGSSGKKVVNRYPGIVQVTFFSPDEKGIALATECIDDVARIFELFTGRDGEGNVITFKAAEFPNASKTNGWYPTIIKIPFYRDEHVPLPS
jgi:hypothetical protein